MEHVDGRVKNYNPAGNVLPINVRKKCLVKYALVLLTVFTTVVIVAIVTWAVSKSAYQVKLPEPQDLEDDILSASYLLSNMNQSVDPCSDFFQYACGNWIQTQWKDDIVYLTEAGDNFLAPLYTYLKEEVSTENTVSQRNLMITYQACTADRTQADTDQITTWLSHLFGLDSIEDIMSYTGELGVFVFLEYAFFRPGTPWVFPGSMLALAEDNGVAEGFLKVQPVDGTGQLPAVMEFLKYKDWTAAYTDLSSTKISKVLDSITFVDMSGYFAAFQLDPDDTIETDIQLLLHIDQYLKEKSVDISFMKALVGLHVQHRFTRYSKEAMSDERCFSYVDTYFGFTIGSLKLDRDDINYDSTISTVQSMADRSVEGYRTAVREADWLSDFTRNNLLEKLEKIRILVGYPPWIHNDTRLRLINFSGELDQSMPFLQIFQLLNKDFHLKYLHQVPGRDPWEYTYSPHTPLNAVFNHDENTISLPLGGFIPPHYHDRWPSAMQYGALGAIISHELTHAFDSLGMNYDSTGKQVDMWATADRVEMEQRQHCFVGQYDGYSLLGQKLSGANTLNENLADNGGLQIAYQVFKAQTTSRDSLTIHGLELTPEQIFFLAFGQMRCFKTNDKNVANYVGDYHIYSPPNYRLIGSIQNSREFAEAFSCPTDSPMNPKTKCQIW